MLLRSSNKRATDTLRPEPEQRLEKHKTSIQQRFVTLNEAWYDRDRVFSGSYTTGVIDSILDSDAVSVEH